MFGDMIYDLIICVFLMFSVGLSSEWVFSICLFKFFIRYGEEVNRGKLF